MAGEFTKNLRLIQLQNSELLNKNESLNQSLKALQQRAAAQDAEEQAKKERRQKYKNRKRLPPRDLIEFDEFKAVIMTVDTTIPRLKPVRTRVCLAIMYITGMRISELRHVTWAHVTRLYSRDKPSLRVYENKTRKWRHAYLQQRGIEVLKLIKDDFVTMRKLLQTYAKQTNTGTEQAIQKGEFFITGTQESPFKPCSRELLTRSVNGTLNQFFQGKDKNIKSHSFRASYINNNWDDVKDAFLVRALINHSSTSVTDHYIKSDTFRIYKMMDEAGIFPPQTELDQLNQEFQEEVRLQLKKQKSKSENKDGEAETENK